MKPSERSMRFISDVPWAKEKIRRAESAKNMKNMKILLFLFIFCLHSSVVDLCYDFLFQASASSRETGRPVAC